MIYLKLFYIFARIGLFGFGGGMAMLPMIYEGASSFGLITKEEFADLVGIAQATPGPIAVNAATYVGYTSAGIPGALAATFGVALPAFVLVNLVCLFLTKFRESKTVEGAFTGIRPVTVGLIASAAVIMAQTAFGSLEIIPIAIFAAVLLLSWKTKISPIWIVIGAGIVGALFLR